MGNNFQIPTKSSKDFIINYNQSNPNIITDLSSFDQRRVVFVSLTGLYNTWHKCPSVILLSALCLLPVKKKWIYNPKKYMNEIKQRDEVYTLLNEDSTKRSQFIKLLKWKDSQGLVFFLLDEEYSKVADHNNDLIAPCWRIFSDKLTDLDDPFTGKKYKPIIFDNKFWIQMYGKDINSESKYGAKRHLVLMELYHLSPSMQYKCLQEIIYQSNPQTLRPVTSYDFVDSSNIPSKFNDATINGDDGWIICEDYEQ